VEVRSLGFPEKTKRPVGVPRRTKRERLEFGMAGFLSCSLRVDREGHKARGGYPDLKKKTLQRSIKVWRL